MIYFIQSGEDGPVKIGFAKTVEGVGRRFGELQTGNPVVLRLLGSMSGELVDEARLHAQFGERRLRGEWFEPCDEILALARAASAGDRIRQELEQACTRWTRLGYFAEGRVTISGALYFQMLEDLAREQDIDLDAEAGHELVRGWAAEAA